ncbi:MAG: CpXC domain-containing protein [Chloroflexota bacterium]|nr:CpXC domain-containing protein [Chloroflexota bacterium]
MWPILNPYGNPPLNSEKKTMSGILLPGQEKRPTQESSGIELPQGFARRREKSAEPAPAAETSAAVAPPPPPQAAPPAAARTAAGQPKVDLLFPPTGAQIRCPNCGTGYTTPVFNIIDLGVNPELKAPLLSGQVNVAACPSCGVGGPLGALLLVHEPAHQFLGVFVPGGTQAGKAELQQQKALGDLTQTLMRKLPNEARKGYMLQPKQFSDWQRFMDQMWEFEGVTPEMLRRQRSQSELLQRLAGLATDPKALELVLQRSADLIDRDFFALLDRLLSMSSAQGQQGGADALLRLRTQLLETTPAGQKLKQQQDKVRAILAGLTAKTTREELLAKVLEAWRGDEGREIVGGLLGAIAPMLDYQFLMLVSQQIESPAAEQDRSRLEELRQLIVSLQEQQTQSQQAVVQQVQQVLQEVLQAPDATAKLREYADYIDETFLSVLAANIQAAQRNNSTAAARRLQQIYAAALAIVQENMPDEMRLLNQLLSAPDKAALHKLLQENRSVLNKEFVETLKQLEGQMREGGRQEISDRIKSVRAQITLMM